MGDQSLVEIPIDKFDFDRNAIQFGGDVSITAVKPVIIIVHDKPFFALMMGPKSFGNKRADKNCERKMKGKVMASAFLSEQLGFISISSEQLAETNTLRAQLQKPPLKYYIERDGSIYPFVHLFKFSKDKEGYWGGDDMLEHTYELLDVLQYLYSDRFTFVYV
jgi:hypothetical protein